MSRFEPHQAVRWLSKTRWVVEEPLPWLYCFRQTAHSLKRRLSFTEAFISIACLILLADLEMISCHFVTGSKPGLPEDLVHVGLVFFDGLCFPPSNYQLGSRPRVAVILWMDRSAPEFSSCRDLRQSIPSVNDRDYRVAQCRWPARS